MSQERHELKLKLQRSGRFDGRYIEGLLYETDLGKSAWFITTWLNDGDPIENYWIEEGEFFEALGINWGINTSSQSDIKTGRLVIGIEENKLDPILNAISAWEDESEMPRT